MIDVIAALGALLVAVCAWQAYQCRRDRRRAAGRDWAARDRQPRRTHLTTTRPRTPEEDR